jgi:uncharacterized membrane protein YraQ (UPF0718 family)
MFTLVFYLLAGTALIVSVIKSREKTIMALKKAWMAFIGIMPEFFVVIITAGIVLAFLDPSTISQMLGQDSGALGVAIAAITGSITLMPGFIAFPLASVLRQQGAGILQIATFISTLMMVGIMTFPVERQVFGTKTAILRNTLAFGFSLVAASMVAFLVEVVL